MSCSVLRLDCAVGEIIINVDHDNRVVTISGAEKITALYGVKKSGDLDEWPVPIDSYPDTRSLAVTIDSRQFQKKVCVVVKNNMPRNYNAFEEFPRLEIAIADNRPSPAAAVFACRPTDDDGKGRKLGVVEDIAET